MTPSDDQTEFWDGKLSCSGLPHVGTDPCDASVGSTAGAPQSRCDSTTVYAPKTYAISINGLCLDGEIPGGTTTVPSITWMAKANSIKMVDPGNFIGALPPIVWQKLLNIREFEISRTNTISCASDGGNKILHDNDWETIDVDAALEQVKQLRNSASEPVSITLKNLCLDGHLQDADLDTAFAHCSKIDLSGNAITGSLELGQANDWNNLEELNLAGNSLTGPIPTVLDELPQLKVLNLAGNGFVGDMLADWGTLCTLTQLDISDNHLTGSLPENLKNCHALTALKLSNNKLTGGIPDDFFTGLDLEFLHLEGQRANGTDVGGFSGPIPSSMFNMNRPFGSLKELKLNDNSFTGSLATIKTSQARLTASMFCPIAVSSASSQEATFSCSEESCINFDEENACPGVILGDDKEANEENCGRVNGCTYTDDAPLWTGTEEACLAASTAARPKKYESALQTLCMTQQRCTERGCSNSGEYSLTQIFELFLVEPVVDGPVAELGRSAALYDNPLQRLTVLQLENNNLDGPLPDLAPYCKMRSGPGLSTFTFHTNGISGKIPQSFAFCTDMTEINLAGLPALQGPLPQFEPALESCGACMRNTEEIDTVSGESTGNFLCPLFTDEDLATAEGDLPGTDDNGVQFRVLAAEADTRSRPRCCRKFKCHDGGYFFDTVTLRLGPTYSRAASEGCPNVCAADFANAPPAECLRTCDGVDFTGTASMCSDSDGTCTVAGHSTRLMCEAADGTFNSNDPAYSAGGCTASSHPLLNLAESACKVYANEYEPFDPPWYSVAPHSKPNARDLCEHNGGWATMDSQAPSSIGALKIDGTNMGSMSGNLPVMDNTATLQSIEVTQATWLNEIPVLQTEDIFCVQNSSSSSSSIPYYIGIGKVPDDTVEDAENCPWIPLYAGLKTLKITHSITPTTTDGMVYAVHPDWHTGDLHGHIDLATVHLHNNNFKGDMPNVDDPHGDQDDDLVEYILSHNNFGSKFAECSDRSDTAAALPDCVPETFQYLYKLNKFDLQNNNMAGVVPLVFFKLAHMIDLKLAYNEYETWPEGCSTFAECSCTSTGTLLDLYHRPVMNGNRQPTGQKIPAENSPQLSVAKLDIRNNLLTELPMYLLRAMSSINAGNNLITARGVVWKETFTGDSASAATERKSIFYNFASSSRECNGFSYPALHTLDLSGNQIGVCTGTVADGDWTALACTSLLEEMLSAMATFDKMVELDLSTNTFTPLVAFPSSWQLANLWPKAKILKLGNVFNGVMPFSSLGATATRSCPEELLILHLMGGELRTEIKIGPYDADAVTSSLDGKFAPYEMGYDSREVNVIGGERAYAYTKVKAVVLKEASYASSDGPQAGVTAVTAARIAKDLGIDFVQSFAVGGATPVACDAAAGDQQCNRCTADNLNFCNDYGLPSTEQNDRELSGLHAESVLTDAETQLVAKAEACYCMKTALLDYKVRHLGCPGMGCSTASCVIGEPNCPPNWQGDYEVSFKIVSVEPVSPPFFNCKEMQQLELQDNQFGGQLSHVYTNLDYRTLTLNGGLPKSVSPNCRVVA
jgi:Leucine-rich repeat (LRR) protein